MGIQYTTNFGVAYMDDLTPLTDLDTVTQQVAQNLDSAMGRAGYSPPDSSTFASLVARVAALEGNNATKNQQRTWLLPRIGTDNQAVPITNMTVVAAGTISNAPKGEYLIITREVISNSANASGTMRTTVGGAPVVGSTLPATGPVSLTASDPRADCIGTSRMTFTMSAGYQHPGGDLIVAASYSPSGTAADVWNAGTMITAAYLGPR